MGSMAARSCPMPCGGCGGNRGSLLPGRSWRRKAAADGVLGDRPRDHELKQIVTPAGLAPNAGHLEAAERLSIDQSAGDWAIEIEIADQKFVFGALERRRA